MLHSLCGNISAAEGDQAAAHAPSSRGAGRSVGGWRVIRGTAEPDSGTHTLSDRKSERAAKLPREAAAAREKALAVTDYAARQTLLLLARMLDDMANIEERWGSQ